MLKWGTYIFGSVGEKVIHFERQHIRTDFRGHPNTDQPGGTRAQHFAVHVDRGVSSPRFEGLYRSTGNNGRSPVPQHRLGFRSEGIATDLVRVGKMDSPLPPERFRRWNEARLFRSRLRLPTDGRICAAGSVLCVFEFCDKHQIIIPGPNTY